MKTKSVSIPAVVAALLATVAIVTVAQGTLVEGESAASTASLDETAWFVGTVDGDMSNDRGQRASVAIDPSDDTIYVSYYDASSGGLYMAKSGMLTGNCGPDNNWYCQKVSDDTVDWGKYSSIAVHTGAGLADWKVGIAHYASSGDLMYSECTYPMGPSTAEGGKGTAGGGCSWTHSTIDTGNPIFIYKGRYTSLAFGANGTPHISYYTHVALGDDSLKYARYVGSGGNCGSGAAADQWECKTIDTGEGVGQYSSINLYGAGADYPEIVYYDSGNDRLKRAIYTGGFGSGCTPALGDWVCNVIDTAGGKYASADRGLDGHLHIAYATTGNKLKYAAYVGSGGNCGPSNTWYCEEIEDIGTDSDSRGISLAIDDAGYAVIAYQDVVNAEGPLESLKVARPAGALGWVPGVDPLNCGGQFTLFATWYCETVDASGYSEQNGDYASVAVSPAGLITVAYYEQDALNSTGYLQVAYQRFQVFLPLVLRND
ncbi:MAG: hypothetical protein JXA14_05130 [Anaerolineae bacterium]|nr:hypothetical protein [Anaerolineae bacterium]